MDFIRAILAPFDWAWFVWGFIAVPLFCCLLVAFIPLIFAPIALWWIFGHFSDAEKLHQLYVEKADKDYLIKERRVMCWGYMYAVVITGVYLFFMYINSTPDRLCANMDGMLPGTMQAVMQWFIPHSC